jgi:hypothetical protein
MSERKPTLKASREFAKAMQYLLSIGWEKKDLPKLEKLWWSIRDDYGNIVRRVRP